MDAILREGLLEGTTLVVPSATGGVSDVAAACARRGAALGAAVHSLSVDPLGDEPDVGVLLENGSLRGGPVGGGGSILVVWDGAGAFAALGEPASVASARAALDGAWLAARSVANAAMIPDARGGKIVLLAPPPGGAHAEAARAGLENLARVTSIEWARFQIKIVAIHPGADTTPDEVAELVAYLASPAGDFASGCLFALR